MSYDYIDKNVSEVRARIDAACASAGRDDVDMLVAVKYATVEEIERLRDLGIRTLGENRVQQMLEHMEALDCTDLDFHFIGTLQTNKVKYIIDKVKMIHSLDSIKLAAEIDKQARKHGLVMDVLVEINAGEEDNKGGLLPCEVEAFCDQLGQFGGIRLRGFMVMTPKCDEKEDYLKYFQQIYTQVIDIWTKKLHNIDRPVISMGMSDSFEEAIASGASIVRIGRGLFVK